MHIKHGHILIPALPAPIMIAQMIHLNSRAAEAFNAVHAAAHYQQVGRCGRTDKCDIKCQFFSIATG